MKAIEKVFSIFGSQKAFAKALGVSEMRVSHWKRRGAPAKAVIPIEEVTGGRVMRHDLRPDIFGPAPSDDEAA